MDRKFTVLLAMAVLIIIGVILSYFKIDGIILQLLIANLSFIKTIFLIIITVLVVFNWVLIILDKGMRTQPQIANIDLSRIIGPVFGAVLEPLLLGAFAYSLFGTAVDILSLKYQGTLAGLPSDTVIFMFVLLPISGLIAYMLLMTILNSSFLNKEKSIIPIEEAHD